MNACIRQSGTPIQTRSNQDGVRGNNSSRPIPDNWRSRTNHSENLIQFIEMRNTSAEEHNQAEELNNQTEHAIFLGFECACALEPARKLTLIQIKVGDIPSVALCDTGARFSLMKKLFFEKIKAKYNSVKIDRIRPENLKLNSIE